MISVLAEMHSSSEALHLCMVEFLYRNSIIPDDDSKLVETYQ